MSQVVEAAASLAGLPLITFKLALLEKYPHNYQINLNFV